MAGGRAARKFRARETDGEDSTALRPWHHEAGGIERMRDVGAGKAERHDRRTGILDAGKSLGQLPVDVAKHPAGGRRGHRDHDGVGVDRLSGCRVRFRLQKNPPATAGFPGRNAALQPADGGGDKLHSHLLEPAAERQRQCFHARGERDKLTVASAGGLCRRAGRP